MRDWPIKICSGGSAEYACNFRTESSLSQVCDDPLEGILPGVHLDDPDTCDDFVHNANSLVSEKSRLESDTCSIQ